MKLYLLCLIYFGLILFGSCNRQSSYEKQNVDRFYLNASDFEKAAELLDKDTILNSTWGKIIAVTKLSVAKEILEKLHVDSVYVYSGGCNMEKLERQYDLYLLMAGQKRIHLTKNKCDSLTSSKGYKKKKTDVIVIGLGNNWSLWYYYQ